MTVTTATRQRLAAALTSQSAAGEILDLLDNAGSVYTFDVTRAPYSALGDGATDDSTSLQAAIDAADAYTTANTLSKAIVYVPDGVFLCEGVTVGASDESNRITISGTGTIKLKDGSASDAAMIVAGNYNRVEGITVDGNASGSPSGRGEGLRVTGDFNVISGVTSQNTKTTGSTGIPFSDVGIANVYENCWSINSGYVGFRMAGDYATVRDCWSLGAAFHGLSVAGGSHESLVVDGFYESSPLVSSASKSGLLLDAGSYTDGDGNKIGYMIRHASLRNIRIDTQGGEYVGVKLGRVHHLEVDGLDVDQGASTESSVKIAEAIGTLSMKNVRVDRNIDQDRVGTATGAITDTEDNGSGFVKFTSTGHAVFSNDYVIIRNTDSYDGLHMVTAADANTFTTNHRWVADNETGNYYEASGSLHFENVTVGDGTFNIAGPIAGLRAYNILIERCRLRGFRDFAIGVDEELKGLNVLNRLEVRDLRIESNDSDATGLFVVAWDDNTQTGQLKDGNVVRISGLDDIHGGAGDLRAGVIGNTDVSKSITSTQTLSAKDSGKLLIINNTDLTLTLPASANIGSGVQFRFMIASGGLSASTGLTIDINGNDKFMGHGVAWSDNQNIRCAGASDAEGDMLEIVSDGVDGWYILRVVGTWAPP